jgi:hypothetical protein
MTHRLFDLMVTYLQMIKRSLLVCLLSLVTGASLAQPAQPVQPVWPQSAGQAFDLYLTYYASNDVRLAELYADNAVLRTRTIYPDGQARDADLTGDRFKGRIRTAAAMGSAKQQLEPSTFTKVRESVEGDFVTVRAERFGKRTCFKDEPFYQIYARRNDGVWLVVQEFSTTVPVSYCQPSKSAAKP